MIDVDGNGTCLVNAVFEDEFLKTYIEGQSSPIKDGYALRLHVIEHMQKFYPTEFSKLCCNMHQHVDKGEGDLTGDGELTKFVDKLRSMTYYTLANHTKHSVLSLNIRLQIS